MDDDAAVRAYLGDAGDWSWHRPDDDAYVADVVEQMRLYRLRYPDGDFPGWIHGEDDIGACASCDALKVLGRQRPPQKGPTQPWWAKGSYYSPNE